MNMPVTEKLNEKEKVLSYKYRIYPNKTQQKQLADYFGRARALYNACIHENKEQWKLYEKGKIPRSQSYLNNMDMGAHMRELFDDPRYPWLRDFPSDIKDIIYRNVHRAYSNFFKSLRRGKGDSQYPRIKKKHSDRRIFAFSIRSTAIHRLLSKDITTVNNRIKVPKMDRIKIKLHRPYKGVVKRVHIEFKAGQYHAILVCKEEKPPPQRILFKDAKKKAVGIKLGIRKLATLSDGTVFDNPMVLDTYAYKLANLQRKLSFKTKGSNGYRKLRTRINKLYLKMVRIRELNQHEVAKSIAEKYDLICLEDLDIKNMFNDKHVDRDVYDASPARLRDYISYKAERLGKRVLYVKVCNTRHNGDANAAKNILNEALEHMEKAGDTGGKEIVLPIKY